MKKIFIGLFILCIACKDASSLSEEEKLFMKTIFSEVFAEKFRICDKIANEISIYSKVEKFKKMTFSSDNFCEKTLQFSPADIKYTFKRPYSDYKGVLLFNYKYKSSKIEFTFIQLETNHVVRFYYNLDHELIKVSENYIY